MGLELRLTFWRGEIDVRWEWRRKRKEDRRDRRERAKERRSDVCVCMCEGATRAHCCNLHSGVAAMAAARVALRVAVDVVTAAATTSSSTATPATIVVIHADAWHAGSFAYNGRRHRTRCRGQRGVWCRVKWRRGIISGRHSLVDGVQTFSLLEWPDLVSWRKSLKSYSSWN